MAKKKKDEEWGFKEKAKATGGVKTISLKIEQGLLDDIDDMAKVLANDEKYRLLRRGKDRQITRSTAIKILIMEAIKERGGVQPELVF